MRTGTAGSPPHGGAAPAWLFARMARLVRVTTILMEGAGVMWRLGVRYVCQTFGCVLGIERHFSELTTITCGALIEGRASSLHVPPATLAYAYRMLVRAHHTAIQDDYSFYHHVAGANRAGNQAVIRQGMDDSA
ncbi:MAG: DUF763 domain-containing protein [Chloroflexi bacterium]|jgi:hypothetical protein|nr:DUF763 domain-containing protein [Chloroflexota bacterium]